MFKQFWREKSSWKILSFSLCSSHSSSQGTKIPCSLHWSLLHWRMRKTTPPFSRLESAFSNRLKENWIHLSRGWQFPTISATILNVSLSAADSRFIIISIHRLIISKSYATKTIFLIPTASLRSLLSNSIFRRLISEIEVSLEQNACIHFQTTWKVTSARNGNLDRSSEPRTKSGTYATWLGVETTLGSSSFISATKSTQRFIYFGKLASIVLVFSSMIPSSRMSSRGAHWTGLAKTGLTMISSMIQSLSSLDNCAPMVRIIRQMKLNSHSSGIAFLKWWRIRESVNSDESL